MPVWTSALVVAALISALATVCAAMIKILWDQIKDLRDRVADLEAVDKIKDDYIGDLRQHIHESKGPPPPDWPLALTTRRNNAA